MTRDMHTPKIGDTELTFFCDQCWQLKHRDTTKMAIGYARDGNDNRICYDCCGDLELSAMLRTGRATLYLTKTEEKHGASFWYVSNWPGTLRRSCHVNVGRHNIAGKRYDAWFTLKGQKWHGITYGDNTQICHCKRING